MPFDFLPFAVFTLVFILVLVFRSAFVFGRLESGFFLFLRSAALRDRLESGSALAGLDDHLYLSAILIYISTADVMAADIVVAAAASASAEIHCGAIVVALAVIIWIAYGTLV